MSAQTIVYFTDSASVGGAEQALLNLVAGLDRGRWRPVLFHHAEPGLAALLTQARRLDVGLCAVPRMPLGRPGAALVPQFVRALRAERAAVFHAHLTWPLSCKYGLAGAILARVPAVVATAHLFIELPYDRSTRLQQRLLAAGVGRYIAVSHAVAGRMRQVFGIPGRRIQVIHNGISLDISDRLDRSMRADALPGVGDRPVVLTVARLDRQKGLCYLLEAAAMVPEALFVLAGDGPERASLETQARDLGLGDRVRLLGYRQDIAALLASCDLFVLPSLYEGLPLSILEAMAAARPVIASAIPGNNEVVVDGETGLLVPAADPAALAAAIRLVLADPALAARLAAAGRARVQQAFSVEVMIASTTGVYDKLLNRTPAVVRDGRGSGEGLALP